MKDLGQIKAQNLATAYTEDNEMIAIVAVSDEAQEKITVLVPVMRTGVAVHAMLTVAQEALLQSDPERVKAGLEKNLKAHFQNIPSALDVSLAADGEALLINVGCGPLLFKLTESAIQGLQKVGRELEA